MPTLKGQMFTVRRPQNEYGLMEAMGAGIGALWKSAEKAGAFAWFDNLMKAAKIETVMVQNLRADASDSADKAPETLETPENRETDTDTCIDRKAA